MTPRSKSTHRKPFVANRVSSLQNQTEVDMPLMEFMAIMQPTASHANLKTWLRYTHVLLNGKAVRQFDTPVKPGDWVEINLSRPFVVFSHPRLTLEYEDDDIIVVNKGYGLLSMGLESGHKTQDTVYSALKEYVKKQNPLNKIFIVHRLDRDTSGLMMFAKTEEAKITMQHNWNNMVLERKYIAVLEGILEEDSGVISSMLDENSQYEVYVTHEPGKGKKAVTRYKVLDRGHGYSLVEFSLDTGRKNQIRVHAASLGHPIAGDRKYGAGASPIHRLALHARTLRFVHPVSRKEMIFELPVPTRFAGLVKYGKSSK